MEGSEKCFSSPSKSTTATPKPSSNGENNENDSSQNRMNFQNHKKIVAKNFMSSTISAASKAAAPRKKILAERNENSDTSDAQNHKTKSPRNSISSHSLTNSNGSSLKGYDPLTNYLSPRPKFLRFNPSRRKEIFNRLEKEDLSNDEVESGSSAEDIKDSSFSPPKESVVSSKNEENSVAKDENISNGVDDDEDEEDEVEDERRWCVKGVLKFLLTLVACLLSTSYICSMNSPTPSPAQQAIWDLKDGFLMIKKQTFEIINLKMHDSGFLEVGVGDGFSEVEGVEIYVETEEGVEEEIVEGYVENVEKHGDYLVEDEIDEAEEIEGVGIDEFEFKVENLDLSIAAKGDENIDAGIEGVGIDEFEFKVENLDLSIAAKGDENIDAGTLGLDPVLGEENVSESETESLGQSITAKEDVIEAAGEYELEKEVVQEIELSVESNSHEETLEKFKSMDDTESLDELVESHETFNDSEEEIDEMGYDNKVEMKEATQWNSSSAVIGISAAISIVFTSMAIIHHLKKSRITSEEKSQPVLKPHKPAEMEEKLTPEIIPTVKRKIEFSALPELLSKSMEEASGRKLSHHSYAPTVELLGEIVVGQVSSCRKTETEEINVTTVFPKNDGGALPPQPASPPTQSSEAKYSAINSPSFGSFTTEKKRVLKKEGRQSGEPVIEVTPVRRSNRLRSRAAVVSP